MEVEEEEEEEEIHYLIWKDWKEITKSLAVLSFMLGLNITLNVSTETVKLPTELWKHLLNSNYYSNEVEFHMSVIPK